ASARRPSSILSGIAASNIMGASRHRLALRYRRRPDFAKPAARLSRTPAVAAGILATARAVGGEAIAKERASPGFVDLHTHVDCAALQPVGRLGIVWFAGKRPFTERGCGFERVRGLSSAGANARRQPRRPGHLAAA